MSDYYSVHVVFKNSQEPVLLFANESFRSILDYLNEGNQVCYSICLTDNIFLLL